MSIRFVTKRNLWKTLLVVFLLAFAALTLLVAAEWTYIQRLRNQPRYPRTGIEWYRPTETVPGAITTTSLPKAKQKDIHFRPEALSNAVHYAEAGGAAAFLVIQDGKIISEEYGIGRGPDSRTDSASMMKTVVALLIGIAIHEGNIKDADEPASNYLPEWAKDERRKITIRNLLQMHSGLRPEGKYDDPFSDACYLAMGTNLRYVVRNIPLTGEPGAHYDYNDVNYQALGFILEHATGQRFASYLSEKLWKPLGNADAMVWLDKEEGEARTFGYLFATAHDWARVGLLILNEGRENNSQIVPAEWIHEMRLSSPSEPTYGAGIYLGPDNPENPPFLATDCLVLNGYGKQRVYIIPSHKLIIVRIGERPPKWNDSFLPNMLVSGLVDSVSSEKRKE